MDKLAYLKDAQLKEIDFKQITPDAQNNWLNQSDSDFELLIPLANRQTKLAKGPKDQRAVFELYSIGVATNRDEWAYDFDKDIAGQKALFFARTYNNFLDTKDKRYDPTYQVESQFA